MDQQQPLAPPTPEFVPERPAPPTEVDASLPPQDEPALPPPAAEPVKPAERVLAVDVLRGFALLGILTMNIPLFAWPFVGGDDPRYSGGADPANQSAWLVNQMVFAGKMMSLFSMLFGAGLVLMGDRAEQRGASIRGVYYRRTLWLLVIGLIHGYLIWFGDILFFYAVCGLLLYLFRRLSPGWLIGLGTTILLIGAVIMLGFTLLAGATEQAALQVQANRAAGQPSSELQQGLATAWNDGLREFVRPSAEEVNREIETYRGSYADIMAHRVPMLFFFHLFGLVMIMFWMVASRMMIGMGLMKLGVFSAERSWRFYQLLTLIGYGMGVPLTLAGSLNLMSHDFEAIHAPFGAFLVYLGTIPTALGHAGVLMLICKAGALTWLTSRLAAVGRMALTNYLMQSLICTTLFYGYGFGLFGYLDRVALWGVVIAIWALQLVISPIWLAHFRYGPAEWLWRTLTYWKVQPMRYAQPASELAIVEVSGKLGIRTDIDKDKDKDISHHAPHV